VGNKVGMDDGSIEGAPWGMEEGDSVGNEVGVDEGCAV